MRRGKVDAIQLSLFCVGVVKVGSVLLFSLSSFSPVLLNHFLQHLQPQGERHFYSDVRVLHVLFYTSCLCKGNSTLANMTSLRNVI